MVLQCFEKNESEQNISVFGVSTMSKLDGPGKRVVVFFQGCNIGCMWCHSPHSQPIKQAPLLYYSNNCLMCRRCESACTNGVHIFTSEEHIINRQACTKCGKCIEACPQSSSSNESGVLYLPTKTLCVTSLFTQLEPYLYLCNGITLSGGEALLQLDASLSLLELCRNKGIHTAVETSGLLDINSYNKSIPLVDTWLFGVRVITSKGNYTNLDKIISTAKAINNQPNSNIIPRIPMIPNVMENIDVLEKIMLVLNQIDTKEIWLNPWNPNYDVYYTATGTPICFSSPTENEIKYCENIMKNYFITNGFNIINNI